VAAHLAEDAAVAAADDEDGLRVGVRHHGQVRDHLLVRELVALGELDDAVEDEDAAVRRRVKHHDVLQAGGGQGLVWAG
jgi:hypothetical protein